LNDFVVDHLDELVNRRNVSGERHLQPALGSAFPRALLGAASAVCKGWCTAGRASATPMQGRHAGLFGHRSLVEGLHAEICRPTVGVGAPARRVLRENG
jgi:hypothetical protein